MKEKPFLILIVSWLNIHAQETATLNVENDTPGQLIEKLEPENGDCTHAILITDSVLICKESPRGFGMELEISNNRPDDQLYFENEHNTVWYKFQAKKSCYLSFDIIPFNKNDDYDFMLFKYNGGDFRSKMMTKQLKPVRTCISRNDRHIDSRTGLQVEGPINYFVHSGVGPSYVTFIAVQKGETYYLAVDNVYANGSGHSIYFHYTCHCADEPYVGKVITLDSIGYLSDDYKFQPGSDIGLAKLYRYLLEHPKFKIEIQGHVNTAQGGLRPLKYSLDQLSELRASAIASYLLNKGIDPKRVTSAGYGDRKKVVPFPKKMKEYYLNIQSGIKIISLDYTKEPTEIKSDNN
jgi:outer membrane protein OmpA-like peptidoglycan-associated protein